METSDLELLRSYGLAGDQSAFTRLVDRHSAWILAASRRRLQDDHLADDATQAVFIVLADKASQLIESNHSSISAWLFHVMHLTCTRLGRARGRQNRNESSAGRVRGMQTSRLPENHLRMVLEDAIAQLPSEDREAVVRRFYEGEDFLKIGSALGITAEAARKRVTRALTSVKSTMLQDGIDEIPDDFLAAIDVRPAKNTTLAQSAKTNQRIHSIAKGASVMVQQTQAIDFTIWSAEFYVKDVETHLDFFEKLGFRRHFSDTPDAMGRIPRASLRGGKTARIWLRRAEESEGTRPTPGVTHYFWIEGGADALVTHRNAIAAQDVPVSAFFDDISLRHFTVTSPDGYSIGFFTAYK